MPPAPPPPHLAARRGAVALMAKADRVLALLEALQDRPSATGPELAQRLGVDVRTVRRDVTALRDLGIPVEGERGRGGSYRLKPGYRVPPLMFTSGEAASVALGLMAARRLGIDTESALAKVRRVLPDRTRLGVEALEHTLGFTGELDAAPPDPEALLAISEAVRRQRRVHARYTDSAGVETARDLSPYGLVAHNGRWYVPAYDHLREDLRAPARRPLRPGSSSPAATEPAAAALRRRRLRLPRPRPRPLDARGRGRPAHHARDRPAPLPPDPRRARAPPRRHAPAPARRLARLGRRPARRRRLRLHRPPPRTPSERPSAASPTA